MKIQYETIDFEGYDSECSMLKDLYPTSNFPTIDDYTKRGTGEIVAFIKGNLWKSDMFLIADDGTKTFIKVKVKDCKF